MASQQLTRENKTDEREVIVERGKVPKIVSRFESMEVKDSGDQPHDQKGHEYKGPSLEDISKFRGTAQQNSMEAILAAEEKYRKSKATMEKSQQSKEGLSSSNVQSGRHPKGSGYLLGATQMAAENAAKAKEGLSSAAQTAAEKAARAKDYTLEKSVQAKDVVAEKTKGVTETAMDATKTGAGYVGEKAVAAKDIALETGKTTAGYVGKVAGVVKDKAVVAGWSAAEFASDKSVGATETLANVTAGVAGFAGNTAVATKDVIVDVGKKTKDMVVSTEESAKEYVARKKAEKQTQLESKNSKGEGQWFGEEQETFDERIGGGMMEEGDFEHGEGGGFNYKGTGGGGVARGVLQVIGETLVEIGENTKDMLAGQGGIVAQERQQLGEEFGGGENKRMFEGGWH